MTELLVVPLVGINFRTGAGEMLSMVPPRCPVELRPNPANPYDANAIEVWLDWRKWISDENMETLRELLTFQGHDLALFPSPYMVGHLAASTNRKAMSKEGVVGNVAVHAAGLAAGMGHLAWHMDGSRTVEVGGVGAEKEGSANV